MGAGKTTLGKLLAKHKNMTFIDLDHYIESRYQKTVSQIFAEQGEDEFRKIEKLLLHEVGEFENVVISTGGGAPCFFENMDYMNSQGKTIYLKSTIDDLIKRLNSCKNKRPLLKDKNEKELFEFITKALNQREVYYNKAQTIFEPQNFFDEKDADRITAELIKKI